MHKPSRPPTGVVVRRPAPADAAAMGRLGASLVALHHEYDPERFIPPTEETERAYGAFLVSQLDRIEVEAEDMAVSIHQAVPVGLVVTEAVTNAVKHAFTPEEGGTIRILLRPTGEGEAFLSITDNGRGMQTTERRGSGLQLMEALARQVRGRMGRDSSGDGTTVCLTFPRPGLGSRG